MTSIKNNEKKYNATNFGQVNSFINEMKLEDWVLTKNSKGVRVGKITSPARLDNKEIDFMLKRTVSWGPTIPKETLPEHIAASFRSPMTLFNIDCHMVSLHHTLYPFFKINED